MRVNCIKALVPMQARPSSELIQSLRLTLQKIEENFTSAEDEPNIAELKRILLLRIADIEAVETLREAEASATSDEPARVAEDPTIQAFIEHVVGANPTPPHEQVVGTKPN